jgi:hypothetical protein
MTDLPDLLANFQRSAWRLEARDTYDIGDERDQYEEFLATGQATPSDEDREFQDYLRGVRASGREIGRVRLVGRPITPYTQFEFAYYPDLVAASEDVQILDRGDLTGYAGPWDTDFWIFDDTLVAIMDYTDSGEFLGVRLLDDDLDIEPFLEARTRAVALARPLSRYTLPETDRRHRRVA